MGDLIHIGDNFAIIVEEGNQEDVDFYILQCQRIKHVIRKAFTYAWGCSFEVDDYVVVGTSYQNWGHGDNCYVCLVNS